MAYDLYEKDMSIINIITDLDYIEISEFTQLLSTILNRKIKPKYINRILLDKGIITKNNLYSQANHSLPDNKGNRYKVIADIGFSCVETKYDSGLFFVWKANFLFNLFNIDFRSKITLSNAEILCSIINKYVKKQFDVKEVYTNLQYLKLILQRECIYYK